MKGRAWGFTLVEALVAMLLATVVVLLVSSAFLAQNGFYSDLAARSGLHENVRGGLAVAGGYLRGVQPGGVVLARSDSLVVRHPMAVGTVCRRVGQDTFLYLPFGPAGVTPSVVGGYAITGGTGQWSYVSATWASLFHSSGGSAAAQCAQAGVDTTRARDDFYRLRNLPVLSQGSLVMIFRETILRLAPSALESGTWGLFLGPSQGPLMEFASGLSPSSRFQYRLAGSSQFVDEVSSAGLAAVETVRIRLRGAAAAARPRADSLTFELARVLPFRNTR